MRGSLIIDFNSIDGRGGDYFDVYVNGIIRDRHFSSINGLYSTYLSLNDAVRIDMVAGSNNQFETLNVYRLDYTTDDENNDKGIKRIEIGSENGTATGTTVTIQFTATTIPNAYDFYYYLGASSEPCFYIGSGFTDTLNYYYGETWECEIQEDKKIVVCGAYDKYSGITRTGIARLNTDGTLDSTFVPYSGFSPFFTVFDTMQIQPDGKILVYSFSVTPRSVYRLNSDGSLDTSFNLGEFDITNDIHAIELQSDGKMLVAGQITEFSGISVNDIIRLNSNGTLDTTFSSGPGISSTALTINDVVITSNNKIIIGGTFTSYSGVSAGNIIQLNSDGSIDNSISFGTGFNESITTILLYNNQIICAGRFSSYNGNSVNDMVILNSDGSLDTSFSVGSGFSGGQNDGTIFAVYRQTDGKFLVGGYFTTFSGQSYNQIVRLNSDGSLDTSFVVGTGFSGLDAFTRVSDIKVNDKGYIYVTGRFNSYNGTPANNFIKLAPDGSVAIC